jgi:predicted DCC family thiol-disulfide oxidoreductase YuxK
MVQQLPVFRAMYDGECPVCSNVIRPGDTVSYDLGHRLVHTDHHDDVEVRQRGEALRQSPYFPRTRRGRTVRPDARG